MSEWRSGARSNREHGGDSRHHPDVECAPAFRPRRDLLADRGRHGEHARISTRDQADMGALGRMIERGPGAGGFLAVVRGVPRLIFPDRYAVEIGTIAVERLGGSERVFRLAREIAVVAGSEPNDRKRAAHGRPSQPGTSTMAK